MQKIHFEKERMIAVLIAVLIVLLQKFTNKPKEQFDNTAVEVDSRNRKRQKHDDVQ